MGLNLYTERLNSQKKSLCRKRTLCAEKEPSVKLGRLIDFKVRLSIYHALLLHSMTNKIKFDYEASPLYLKWQ